MLKLYGANPSPFVRKVKVFLAEKNLPFEQEQTSPFPPSAEYRKISPLGRIPAFQDGDKYLADSSIICAYLEHTHPQPALYPADPYANARALWFEEYSDSGLSPIIGSKMFFNKVVGPLLMKTTFDEALFRKAEQEDLPPMYSYLEGELQGEFLVGNSLTIGDIGVGSQFVNLLLSGVTPDAGKWPKLAAYISRIHSRPSFKPLIEGDKKMLRIN
ncbi:MAG TPA: glutathione S-transferase family protein [Candidatus Binataceae bacterium]|jgi:glutathione S-transferase|nr:glutathione S-transferase family protein [Candidatus Binataceae bacterium]